MKEILGNITLYNADCMNILRALPDNSFDLAIVDPPYGIQQMTGRETAHGRGKLKNRILNQRADDFINWDIAPSDAYFNELFRVSKNQIIWGGNYFNLPPSRCIVCWDKVQPWENFSQIELAWTSFDSPARLVRIDNRIAKKTHPTQKPVKLYKWLLHNYASAGQTILDTHFGSLSIGIACHDLNFALTAIEMSPDYYNAAKERIVEHQKQLRIW